MKRITSLMVAFMMVLTLVPCTSFATEKTVNLSESYVNPLYQDVITEADLKKPSDNGISTYSTQKYFTEESEVIEALREGMTQREEQVTVYYFLPEQIQSGYLNRWIEQAYAETGSPKQGDYLRWHLAGASSSGSASVNQEGYRYTLNFTLTYYTSAEQEDMVDQAVNSLIAELGISDDMSDYEKLCAFYDYVCENVTYDYDNLENAEYKLKYSAYAALIDKTAVCQGYSNLMYRLLNEVGVKCRMISGQAGGPHGWNIVKLDDKYYLLDATWDAPRKAAGVAYKYFVKGMEDFSKDHTADAEYMTDEFKAIYPVSETDYSPCNHQWGTEYTIDKEATCDKDGSKSYHCEICNAIQPGSNIVIEATGHTYTAVATPPTCTSKGYTTYTCHCGYSYVGDEVAMLNHTEEVIPGVEATCTEAGLTAGAKCTVCGEITIQQEEIPVKEHAYGDWIIETEASCEAAGEKYRVCVGCGDEETEGITASGHTYSAVVTEPTCTKGGYTTYTCHCGDTYIADKVTALGHKEEAIKGVKATSTKAGLTAGAKCSVCGVITIQQEKIPAIKSVKLSYSTTTYNGSVRKPGVKVTDTAGNDLKEGTDYSVTYATGRKNVGKYKVTISFKGNYDGKSVSKEFKINPKGVVISKLTKAKKSFKVSWKRPATTYRKQMTGYQIRYSMKSSMASAKTVTVKSTTATNKTIKTLKAKKKYYVQIRTYKTVKGVKYYSAWSSKKSVTTK